jgi:hypothetical protein
MLVICAFLVNDHVKIRIGRRVVGVDHLNLIDHLIGNVDIVGLVEIDGRTKALRCRNITPDPSIDPWAASCTSNAQPRLPVQVAVGAEVFDRDSSHDLKLLGKYDIESREQDRDRDCDFEKNNGMAFDQGVHFHALWSLFGPVLCLPRAAREMMRSPLLIGLS